MLTYTLRHSLRRLVRERGFTLTAVLTLALGLGFNLAIFAVVEALMLRPLPYESAEDLVVLRHMDRRTGLSKPFIAIGDYIDLQQQGGTAFAAIGAYGGRTAPVSSGGESFQANILLAGPGLLEALGVRPPQGRLLQHADARQGGPAVAMMSHGVWERQFRSDPGVIGRTLQVGATATQIVGILPAGFAFPAGASTDLVVPLTLPPAAPANRKAGWVFAVARLQPGTSLADAAVQLEAQSARMEREHPEQNTGSLYYPVSLRDHLLGDTKRPILLLLVAVGVVLLIASANVGNLLLARALARRQEMAVRIALGAGRLRLLLQVLGESLALTLLAGGVGSLLAYWSIPALLALVPPGLAAPGLSDVGLNPAVFGYALALCVAVALAFALLSTATLRQTDGAAALTAQTRVAGSRLSRRLTSALVVAEIALSVVLLLGAGLILRSFAALLSVDPGFTVDRVAVLEIALPAEGYRDVGRRREFFRQATASLGALPGVTHVGASAVVPLTGNNWTVPFERADRPSASGARPPDVGWQSASSGYFRALGIPLVSGRPFEPQDITSERPVVIVSRSIERQYFDGEPAVGRRVRVGDGEAEIIGVVGDIRRTALTDAPWADMYFPFDSQPPGSGALYVATSGDPAAVLASARAALRQLEPGLVLPAARTLSGIASASIASTRLVLWLLGAFATAAVALAAVGIYGVMSYIVRGRTREFGTRVALGAGRGDILRLVMRQGAAITAAGLTVGLGAGLLLARSLSSVLYGVSESDPLTVVATLLVLGCASLAACYVPARRATRLDAARTLAGE